VISFTAGAIGREPGKNGKPPAVSGRIIPISSVVSRWPENKKTRLIIEEATFRRPHDWRPAGSAINNKPG